MLDIGGYSHNVGQLFSPFAQWTYAHLSCCKHFKEVKQLILGVPLPPERAAKYTWSPLKLSSELLSVTLLSIPCQ